jgi:hypothetical protein
MTKLKSTLAVQLLLIFTLFICLASCKDIRCVDGNNEMISQSRPVISDFEGISLSSGFTVFISHSLEDSILIEAESNLLPNISTEVINHRLEIKTIDNSCLNPQKPVIIRIYTNRLNYLDISGSGSVTADSLISEQLNISVSGSGSIKAPIKASNLSISIAGSGNVEIWGKTSRSQLEISGSGSLESYGLDQDSCFSAISGSGNIFIFVRNALEASISGSGSVYYKGNPEVSTHISGTGKVVNQKSSANNSYPGRGSYNSVIYRSMYMIY